MFSTIEYYNNNSQYLCDKYNSIDLSLLHNELLDYFKDSKTLLEIGSGSGRDLYFFLQNSFDVTGIDGSLKMIDNALINYPKLKDKIEYALLPDNFPVYNHKFDGLYSIATLMHFTIAEINILLRKFQGVLKPGSLVFFTVSGIRKEANKERYFLDLSKEKWIDLFKINKFELIKVKENQDYSGRDIIWYSFFLKTEI